MLDEMRVLNYGMERYDRFLQLNAGSEDLRSMARTWNGAATIVCRPGMGRAQPLLPAAT